MTVLENIDRVYLDVERLNAGAKIVAATKTQSVERIKEALKSNKIFAAGENRVQELCGKYFADANWHFIGRLQTNKVKYLIGKVTLIQSLDRLPLAEAIEKESAKAGVITDTLIEVNAGKEETKGGIYLETLTDFLAELSAFKSIRVRGIMTVAPADFEIKVLEKVYTDTYKAFEKLKSDVFDTLSMGMSNDYKVALSCGANMIRVGSAIFGARL